MDGKTDPKLWAIVTIVVAIISCVGILGAAAINALAPQVLKPTPIITSPENTVSENTVAPQVVIVTATASLPIVETSIPAQSNQDSMNCGFIDELVTKADIIQKLYEGQNLSGIQARLVTPIDVPVGWIVQFEGTDYYAPVHFDTGTIASFWSPNSCRPLTIK